MRVLNNVDIISSTIKELSEILVNGGIGVWKTDTIYGYFARYDDRSALAKIDGLKRRNTDKYFSLAVEDISKYFNWFLLTEYQKNVLKNLLPGPYTFVLPIRELSLNKDYFDEEFLGVRMPDHLLTQNICFETGIPLITTSANISGRSQVNDISEIPGFKDRKIDFIIDSGKIQTPLASTVVKLAMDDYIFLREGAVSKKEFENIWVKLKKEIR